MSQSEVGAKNYERPKSREFKPGQFRDSTLGVAGKSVIWMQVRWRGRENTIVMDWLQKSGELQDKTSFIDPLTGVDMLKGCFLDYLLL